MEPNQLLELRCVEDVQVAVVALGCVGLPTALSFADQEAEAIGLDGDEGRLAAIKDNRVEPLPDDGNILRAMATISVTRLKRAGRKSELTFVDGPSDGAGRLAAAHGARVVLRHPWNGGE